MNLDTYKAAYEQAMSQQGVKVTWNEDGVPGGVPSVGGYNNPDNWVATLSRDGVKVDTLVTLGRIQVTGMTPEELAAQDIQFALKYTGQVNSPQGQVPSKFFDPVDDDTRRFYEVYPERRPGYIPATPSSRPGPATTVPTGDHSTQTRQSPPVPNNGTVVRPGAATGAVLADAPRLTFWQWNYYHQQATGRVGPSPEEVGVASGTQLMTGPEWVAAIGNYYGSAVSIPPVGTGGSGGVGSTPTTPSIPVGGTGTGTGSQPPVGGGAGAGAGAGAGGGGGAGAGSGAGPTRRSFWEWNALKEQSTGIVGDDPAHYGIQGSDLMTLADWSAITAAYYASKQTPGATKPADNTMLYLAAAAVALVVLGKRG